jgi:hypothetical protein
MGAKKNGVEAIHDFITIRAGSPLRPHTTKEGADAGDALAQPHPVLPAKDNPRRRSLFHRNKNAVEATIESATASCQSMASTYPVSVLSQQPFSARFDGPEAPHTISTP